MPLRCAPAGCYDKPMQRPARIMIFGAACLVVGAVSGIHNLSELGVAIIGPDALPEPDEVALGQGFAEMMSEQLDASRRALGIPAYRVTFGINSLAGMFMAVVLITAGVGLMMSKLIAVRIAQTWAYFALLSGAVTVVLNARYIMSEMPSAPPGGAVMMGVCMLPFLWLFPILLLTVLPRPVVMKYLQNVSETTATPIAMDQPMASSSVSPPQSLEPPASRPTSPSASSTDSKQAPSQNWRDDPWND